MDDVDAGLVLASQQLRECLRSNQRTVQSMALLDERWKEHKERIERMMRRNRD